MKKEIEIQQENINELMKLAKENPNLKIIPMVDIDICASDDFGYWAGSFGKPRIDEYYADDERIYFKRDDYDRLMEDFMDNLDNETLSNFYDEVSLQKYAEEHINNLGWEKVIVVYIGTP